MIVGDWHFHILTVPASSSREARWSPNDRLMVSTLGFGYAGTLAVVIVLCFWVRTVYSNSAPLHLGVQMSMGKQTVRVMLARRGGGGGNLEWTSMQGGGGM